MAFEPICPRCKSEAVMADRPGKLPGNTLMCVCQRCHYSAPNFRFASRNGKIEIENRLSAAPDPQSPNCPTCDGETRIDGVYLMCDACKRVVGGILPDITMVC